MEDIVVRSREQVRVKERSRRAPWRRRRRRHQHSNCEVYEYGVFVLYLQPLNQTLLYLISNTYLAKPYDTKHNKGRFDCFLSFLFYYLSRCDDGMRMAKGKTDGRKETETKSFHPPQRGSPSQQKTRRVRTWISKKVRPNIMVYETNL